MALATYQGLCLDATDADGLAAFWAAALDLQIHRHDDGVLTLSGPGPEHTVRVNPVPEPRSAKNRVHLDLNASSVAEIERLGATLVETDRLSWTVLSDPDGGELCVFVREGPIESRLFEVVVDCADDPRACHDLASWWAQVLGGRLVDDPRGISWVEEIPGTPFDTIDFVPVPEPKTTKNRVHLDLRTPDLDALVESGATVLRPREVEPGGSRPEVGWTVLADPAGNEFCAVIA